MTSLQLTAGVLALVLSAGGIAQAQAVRAPAPSAAAAENTGGPMEAAATQALDRMAAYLRTLNSFEIKTQTSRDLVTDNGQRLQIDGTTTYKVRRPDSFVISVDSEWKKRDFYYDGKQFTLSAPELGYYASAPAPGTIRETLQQVSDRYGIELPLEDLFLWNDPSHKAREGLTSAMHVGAATIDGVKTDQYAFRQGDVDWQVWIEQGDKPLPRKLVIVDRTDPAQPAYTARLAWNTGSSFKSEDFAFKPGKDSKAIVLTSLGVKP